MASDICWKDQCTTVSNMVLNRILDHAEETGRRTAKNAEEGAIIDALRRWREESYWPGIIFDLEEIFPSLDAKKLWARVFGDVARRIFRSEQGNMT